MKNLMNALMMESELEVVNNDVVSDEVVLVKILSTMSSESKFEDNVWVIDLPNRYKNVPIAVKSIYFNSTDDKYVDLVKYFALIRLGNGTVASSISNNITCLNVFFRYLEDNYKNLNLKDVNKKIINSYRDYLSFNVNVEKKTKEAYWTSISKFFKLLRGWSGMPEKNIVGYVNPFSVKRSNKKSKEEKYIPENVLAQLDVVMMKDEIPLYFRTVYWICRLIPNRITEVCSMNRDCIKSYINDKVIAIPTFKQDSGLLKPKLKNIAIKEEGVGKYLLNLIRSQIEISKSLSNSVDDEIQSNFLFLYEPMSFIKKSKKWKLHSVNKKRVCTFKLSAFNTMLKNICEIYNIVDEEGKIYSPTSHQFRHVGITDRLYEGFRLIDIMSMTEHKTSKMIIQNYLHVKQDELDNKSRAVLGEDKPAVLFNGRIINFNDERKVKEILRRPFAHRIGRLGLCSDISNCSSEMFECLSCNDFIPNADELEYFEAQVEDWDKKVKRAGGNLYLKENAQYNLELNRKIVEKIKAGIYDTKELKEVLNSNV